MYYRHINIHYYKHSYINSTPLISLVKPGPCTGGSASSLC